MAGWSRQLKWKCGPHDLPHHQNGVVNLDLTTSLPGNPAVKASVEVDEGVKQTNRVFRSIDADGQHDKATGLLR